MWGISLNWWEFVVRAIVVYVFVLVILRLTGKRQVGQMAPFDLVLLLILSNAVQNSMNGGDNSVTGGLILAATLVSLNYFVSWLSLRSRKFEALVEGRPIILVHDGKVDPVGMRHALMTKHELDAELRSAGCTGPSEVRFAILENTGKVTVIPRRQDNSHRD